MEFTTTLQLDGKTATGIRVPDEVVAALGGGKRIPVSVTINGTRYASTIATIRGEPKIPVSADMRSCAGIAAGDSITVELERDDAPRTVDLPVEFADALCADPATSDRFAALSYSNQRRHVLYSTHHRDAHPAHPARARRTAHKLTARTRADEPWHGG
jgi:hypothetical protein